MDDINDYANGAPGSVLGDNLGIDAVQQVSALEYVARWCTSGGVINVVTRSGKDAFHGSLYDLLRNSALDARNFFDGPAPFPSISAINSEHPAGRRSGGAEFHFRRLRRIAPIAGRDDGKSTPYQRRTHAWELCTTRVGICLARTAIAMNGPWTRPVRIREHRPTSRRGKPAFAWTISPLSMPRSILPFSLRSIPAERTQIRWKYRKFFILREGSNFRKLFHDPDGSQIVR